MSRFRNLFFGKNNNADLRGQSYDSAVALDPPVKGSYPVAGNGPSVLDEIQRTRAKRQSLAASTRGSIPPKTPRQPEPIRPKTAPHNGERGGGHDSGTKSKNGRTLSGFSMKSPPSFFGSRRSSVSSKRETIRITSDAPPPLPTSAIPPQTYIPTYQPSTGSAAPSIRKGFAPPAAPFAQQHNRNISTASHRTHVDLLDAHSNINRTREASRHRAKASGVRNYGEDVADRNISDFSKKKSNRDSKLDLNSPEFSYLKQVYSPKKRPSTRGDGEPHSRTSSALGHILGSDSDDTQPQSYPRTSSIRSFTGPRPGHVYPPRGDSVNSNRASRTRISDDEHSSGTNLDRRGRALSPSTTSIREEPQSRRIYPPTTSTPPIPERVRPRAISVNPTGASRHASPPPVSSPPVKSNSKSNYTPSGGTYSKQRPRNMSTTNDKTARSPTANGGTSSRKGSVNYSAFPPLSGREQENLRSESNESLNRSPIRRDSNKRGGMAVEGASQPPSLEGIVDLKDSVDSDVTTRTLPAVVHEHITPTRHDHTQELITREIHTHDIYHRVLPITETEILPTKHYVLAPDTKTLVEIPESQLPKSNPDNWHIASGPASSGHQNQNQNGNYKLDAGNRSSSDSAPDGPVIGLARGEPKSTRHTRGESTKSTKSSRSAKDIFHPILHSKKDAVSKEGIPRTEYVWRRPPVFETGDGKIQPATVKAAFAGGGGEGWYSSGEEEDDAKGREFGAGDLLFRDSGYGSGGMLPGLTQRDLAVGGGLGRVGDAGVEKGVEKGNAKGKEKEKEKEGEATKYLRKMRARRKSSGGKANVKSHDIQELEERVRAMGVK